MLAASIIVLVVRALWVAARKLPLVARKCHVCLGRVVGVHVGRHVAQLLGLLCPWKSNPRF